MALQVINPEGSPPRLAPYSPGMRSEKTVYVSGTLAVGADGSTVGVGDIKAQTRHVLEGIRSVVEAAGGTMANVAYNMIFLKDLADYKAMNEIYGQYFPTNPPARFCIRADLVRPEFLVEITSIAHL